MNDQWYQFIYNDHQLNDSGCSGTSKFTLRSKFSKRSNMSQLSQLQNHLLFSKSEKKADPGAAARATTPQSPLAKLRHLIDNLDIFKFIRVSWLLSPMINGRKVRTRLFNFN